MLLDAFLAALDDGARAAFDGDDVRAQVADQLARHLDGAHAAYPTIEIDGPTFARELARRLGAAATPELLAQTRAEHVYLAIACVAGDADAARTFEREFLREVDACAGRMRGRPDQAAEVRGHLSRILFVSEPGRPAALGEYSGRGDLRSYVRVMATRELVRVIDKGKKEVGIADDAMLDLLSPGDDPELGYLRDHYRDDVHAAMREALTGLSEQARAVLRYHLIDGWSIDRIGALYGVHRVTASRWIIAARQALGAGIRAELAARLAISIDDVDSIVRLVQSRIDVSIERLLQPPGDDDDQQPDEPPQ